MKKNKIKYIFECAGPSELTQFNKAYNQTVKDTCERVHQFEPNLFCLQHNRDGNHCKYLKIHTYKGDK